MRSLGVSGRGAPSTDGDGDSAGGGGGDGASIGDAGDAANDTAGGAGCWRVLPTPWPLLAALAAPLESSKVHVVEM